MGNSICCGGEPPSFRERTITTPLAANQSVLEEIDDREWRLVEQSLDPASVKIYKFFVETLRPLQICDFQTIQQQQAKIESFLGQEEEGPGLKQAWRDELRRMYEGNYFGMRIFRAFVACLV